MSNIKSPSDIIDRILNKSDSYYSILGVLEIASQEEINKAYKTIVMKLHPDRCKLNNASKAFIKASEAYETLSDEKQKLIYDKRRQNTGIFTSDEIRDIFNTERSNYNGNVFWNEFIHQNNYNNPRFYFSQTSFFRSPADVLRIFQRDLLRRNQQNNNQSNRFDEFMRIYTIIICIIILFKIISYV